MKMSKKVLLTIIIIAIFFITLIALVDIKPVPYHHYVVATKVSPDKKNKLVLYADDADTGVFSARLNIHLSVVSTNSSILPKKGNVIDSLNPNNPPTIYFFWKDNNKAEVWVEKTWTFFQPFEKLNNQASRYKINFLLFKNDYRCFNYKDYSISGNKLVFMPSKRQKLLFFCFSDLELDLPGTIAYNRKTLKCKYSSTSAPGFFRVKNRMFSNQIYTLHTIQLDPDGVSQNRVDYLVNYVNTHASVPKWWN